VWLFAALGRRGILQPMHLISLESISKSYPETPVLSEVSLGIGRRQRIGVIGRNGSGKSTLLRIIAGTEEPDMGTIVRSAGLRVSSLSQDPSFPAGSTVGDAVGDDREAIAMADRLGIADPSAAVAELSGGQRKRLALALALATECDLLILDEPTNHLDIDTIDWLEEHLLSRTSVLVLVTHDRYLLDRVANRVVEVHHGSLHSHQGTYDQYLEARTVREEHEATVEHRRRQRLRTELEWLRRSPKARTSKSKARVNAVHELMATKRPPIDPELSIDLPSRRIGSKVVNLDNAGKHYESHWVLRNLTFNLLPDARIGVVGSNGSGKTTLLRLIAGRLPPDEGSVTMGSTIVPGVYGQDPQPIPPNERLIAVVRERAESTLLDSGIRVSAAKLLERFQFATDAQSATIGDLSGGERRRLELLLTLMEAPNLLLLDEPTNDLDLDTLEVLEEYLDAWPGAFVVASHDRYFLDRVCDDIFSIEPDGSVQHHPGGWAAYWATRQIPPAESPRSPAEKSQRSTAPRTKPTWKERQEFKDLTKRIPRLEKLKQDLSAQLDAAGSDYVATTDLAHRLNETIAELDDAETSWLELSEQMERYGNI
ncbi:MAG: ABC-F family ATP-binding cassette domain-containing protein, partial [Actinomycetota bacterium]|nr:ABC-F family ATP-binding cassette domain-containing protein [Actinomycetota bacterium]